jgi:hypothetical protein
MLIYCDSVILIYFLDSIGPSFLSLRWEGMGRQGELLPTTYPCGEPVT